MLNQRLSTLYPHTVWKDYISPALPARLLAPSPGRRRSKVAFLPVTKLLIRIKRPPGRAALGESCGYYLGGVVPVAGFLGVLKEDGLVAGRVALGAVLGAA